MKTSGNWQGRRKLDKREKTLTRLTEDKEKQGSEPILNNT